MNPYYKTITIITCIIFGTISLSEEYSFNNYQYIFIIICIVCVFFSLEMGLVRTQLKISSFQSVRWLFIWCQLKWILTVGQLFRPKLYPYWLQVKRHWLIVKLFMNTYKCSWSQLQWSHSVRVLTFFSLKSDTISIQIIIDSNTKKMNTLCTRRVLTKASKISNSLEKITSETKASELRQAEKLECTVDESGSGPDYEHLLHTAHWALFLPVCTFDRLFFE